MKKYQLETAVGIFVVLGLCCVAYLTIKLGKMEFLGGDSYLLKARFTNVSGVKPGAAVEISGVKVGKIGRVLLDGTTMEAMVELQIDNGVKLPEDTMASIKTSGLIGDKYVALSPGGMDTLLKPGSLITDTESAVDVESLISKYAFGGVQKKQEGQGDTK